MKRKIVFTLALLVMGCTTLFAQKATTKKVVAKSTAASKTATKTAAAAKTQATATTNAAVKPVANATKKAVKCIVTSEKEGFKFVFDPTANVDEKGRPFDPVKKEFIVDYKDNSVAKIKTQKEKSDEWAATPVKKGEAAMTEESQVTQKDKISMQDLHFTIDPGNNPKALDSKDGQCSLPTDLIDGVHSLHAVWLTVTTPAGGEKSEKKSSAVFLLNVKDGVYTSIITK